MFSSAMIFMREMTPAAIRRCTLVTSASTPSTRKRTRSSLPVGSQVDVRGAALDRLGDELVDELDHGRVFGGLVQRDDLRPVLGLLVYLGGLADYVFEPVQARDQRRDVIRRGDRHANLVAGHDRDVVDRQHVRGSAIATSSVRLSANATGTVW